MIKLNLTFISNKQLKLNKYFKDDLVSDGNLFLQETHLIFDDKALWETNFQGQLFFGVC